VTRRALWIALAVVVVVALAVGSRTPADRSTDQRLHDLAAQVRCPQCAGQSVASSDAPAARAIRAQILEDIEDGRTDSDILARLADGPYDDILLNPPRSGFAALVWIVPVAAVVIAFGGLALAFRRWEKVDDAPTRRDRQLVEAALSSAAADPHGEGDGR